MNKNNPQRKKKPAKKNASTNQQAGPSRTTGGKGKGKQVQPQQTTLAARTAARKTVANRKRAAGDMKYTQALHFFDAGQYEAALESLKAACMTFKTQPKYALKMAATLSKLERYDDAIDMASYAIAVQPNDTFNARLLRATIFIKDQEYDYAAADLVTCKRDKPDSQEVASAIQQLHELWDVDDEYLQKNPDEANKDIVYPDFANCTANFDLDCNSDTEESTHKGDGRVCTNYNQGMCKYGKDCYSRHSVDSRSIRDQLGRNVCIFHIIGRCHFSAGGRCWYSHSTSHLPKQGWWNDAEYVAYYRSIYDVLKTTGSNQVMDLMLGGDMNGQWRPFERRTNFAAGMQTLNQPENLRRAIYRRCEEAVAQVIGMNPKDVGRKGRNGVLGQALRYFGVGYHGQQRRSRRYEESDSDDYDYDEYGEGGYDSDGDLLQEMLSLGIKPWDEDAYDILAYLASEY
ncbi:hypothetical protein MIND_00775200 [Mycena indigotica]|uniref:C3H1-type domain-containing protein n=1 Tax=Mycena indigotica TaxID=2126181 RepID=A0A8H6SNG4_9AGAR|nr:uncharacterized protein MIND_00775200 [Mycena indigotica]KAF7302085.1 hypothetical protein MIND_00775200 [Mycena indigotica]